jgi:hypothetical protein
MNKTNRCTEFQLYWYYDSTCFGQPFCPSSGILSRTSALVHYMLLWWPYATRSRMAQSVILLLVAYGPDDGQKGCPKHVESSYKWRWNSVRLLILFILICYDAWSCDCCVLWGIGLCDGLITRPEESYRVLECVSECDHEASIMRRS